MKEVPFEQFLRDAEALTAAAQHERILITKDGEPFAVLAGIAYKDEEDCRLEASPEFWRMIEERRRGPTVPLEEVVAELWAGKDLTCHYSMVIQWSEEDRAFVVALPEFEGGKAHGATYEEAAERGREALEALIETFQAEGRPLPEPLKLGAPIAVG